MINFILNLFGKNNDRRFYYLSLIYENNRWTIHGLWPQNSKDNYPTYCKLVNFDENKLKPIINDLNQNWHSDRENNDKFWEHEWKKHGSCMFCNMDEFDYFNKTLELFKYVKENNLIENYIENNTALIPFSLSFKLI